MVATFTKIVAPPFFLEFLTLLRRHVLPLLAQFGASLRRQVLEPLGAAAQALLLFRRQLAEAFVAFARHLALFWRHFLPAGETVLRLFALLGRHGLPAFRALLQVLAPPRRQAVPAFLEGFQGLLFLLAELVPGKGSAALSSQREGRPQQQQAKD